MPKLIDIPLTGVVLLTCSGRCCRIGVLPVCGTHGAVATTCPLAQSTNNGCAGPATPTRPLNAVTLHGSGWFGQPLVRGTRKAATRKGRVVDAFRHKGYEPFLPLYRSKRSWSDYVSTEIELPLFPGYVFCRFQAASRLPIVTTPGVVYVVGVGGTPAPIDDREVAALQAVSRSGLMRRAVAFPANRPARSDRHQALCVDWRESISIPEAVTGWWSRSPCCNVRSGLRLTAAGRKPLGRSRAARREPLPFHWAGPKGLPDSAALRELGEGEPPWTYDQS